MRIKRFWPGIQEVYRAHHMATWKSIRARDNAFWRGDGMPDPMCSCRGYIQRHRDRRGDPYKPRVPHKPRVAGGGK